MRWVLEGLRVDGGRAAVLRGQETAQPTQKVPSRAFRQAEGTRPHPLALPGGGGGGVDGGGPAFQQLVTSQQLFPKP